VAFRVGLFLLLFLFTSAAGYRCYSDGFRVDLEFHFLFFLFFRSVGDFCLVISGGWRIAVCLWLLCWFTVS